MRASCFVIAFLFSLASPVARTQAFSHVSITTSSSPNPGDSRLRIIASGDLIGHALQTFELISLAYDVPYNPSPRLSSPPGSIYGETFDIEARVPASLKLDTKDLPTQKRIIKQLVRNLLIDHFGLVIQVRMQRMPVYVLAVSKRPLRLSRAHITSRECILDLSPEGCHDFAPGFGHPLDGRAVDMSDLAHYLENWTDLPVVDRTGLDGLFIMHSRRWKPIIVPPPPPGTHATGDEFASLPPLSAVLGDLGLELVRREESVPIYSVKSIRQPNAK